MKQFFNTFSFKKKLLVLSICMVLMVMAVSVGAYFLVFKDLPTASSLRNLNAIPFSTHIYDRNGKILYEIYRDQNRTPVKLGELKPYIYDASIAIEDKDFYHHKGISLTSGVLRAIKELVLRQSLQGGSTITQQLVKNALLSSERTLQRKLREMVLAVSVEKQFSKQEILEMYMNQVPYGGSAYGVEEGAKTFFGKKAKDLKLEEAALLAGLPQAPSLYSPYINPALTKKRRDEVLLKMQEQNYITEDQKNAAMATPLGVIPLKTVMHAPHFVFYVKSLLEKEYGADLVEQGGLKVTTTLDLDIQEKAEQILKDELEKIRYLDVSNGALLITRPPTGEILAMVGSGDYYATGSGAFNVTTALRQPGSSIKPLNYAVGIDRKLVTASTVFLDIPTCFTAGGQPGSYCPVNYDGQFHGPTQLRFTLGNSFNIPAVKMLAVNGVSDFIASASAFTITSFEDPRRYGLSLTLGGGEVRMTEMAQAFSAFANQGVPRKLNQILKVEDRYGKVLYKFDDPNIVTDVKKSVSAPSALSIPGKRAISKEASYIISHILLDDNARSAAFGTGSYLVIPGKAVSVKTGTTDDKKDNWTIGYTPNFLTAVWVGNNDNTPMNPSLTSGVTGAAPIWNKVMRMLLADQPDLWPIKPETVIGKQVCNDSGGEMTKEGDGKENCSARYEYFIKGTEPKGGGNIRQSVPINKDTDKLASPSDTNVENRDKTIIRDMFSNYCVDCNHDKDPYTIVRL
ncbi:MAG: transglycosylase domain-containing protein [bacterium]